MWAHYNLKHKRGLRIVLIYMYACMQAALYWFVELVYKFSNILLEIQMHVRALVPVIKFGM